MYRLLAFALPACTTEYVLIETPDPPDYVIVDTGEAPEPPADTPASEEAPPEEPVFDDPPTEPDPAEPVVEDPPPADDCDATSDLVYVIARDENALYLFDPSRLTFNRLGVLRCGTNANPGSMAVGRDGHAYVRYDDQTIKDVDLRTMQCTDTAYSDRRTQFGPFGMGFTTDVAGGWRETLYIANFFDLASLNTSSWSLDLVGGVPSQPELTGTANGDLWMFLPLETPAELVEVDKANGRRNRTVRLNGFPRATDIDAFAFAHWGGSFWLFVREFGMGRSTDVYQVDANRDLQLVTEDIGFDIVGAGVSTCAPTANP
jgi:hypothetical protein